MIRHIWSVLCSQAVIDAQSNNVSLFNVIEQISVTIGKKPDGAIPLLNLPLELVTLWERGGGAQAANKGQMVVDVVDPTGKRLGGQDVVVDVSAARRCRTTLAMGGIPITTSGRYVVRVGLRQGADDQPSLVAEVPLEVNVAYKSDAPSSGEPPPPAPGA